MRPVVEREQLRQFLRNTHATLILRAKNQLAVPCGENPTQLKDADSGRLGQDDSVRAKVADRRNLDHEVSQGHLTSRGRHQFT